MATGCGWAIGRRGLDIGRRGGGGPGGGGGALLRILIGHKIVQSGDALVDEREVLGKR